MFKFLIKGPSTLATLFNHMWPRIVAGIFIPVGNHYFQALASTLQLWLKCATGCGSSPPQTERLHTITYMSPPHVALVCSGPPQCAATCGWTKWPVCSGPNTPICRRQKIYILSNMAHASLLLVWHQISWHCVLLKSYWNASYKSMIVRKWWIYSRITSAFITELKFFFLIRYPDMKISGNGTKSCAAIIFLKEN